MPDTPIDDNPDASGKAGGKAHDLSAFERVQLARHNDRPYTLDFVERLLEDFVEIHGDRRFADDTAIICGMASFHGLPVVVVGHQKGRDMKQRRYRNFGMPKPEGYRKALRAMKLADKFGRPVICFIDTPGAYPGIDAEERGQAEAIAYNLRETAKLRVPVIIVVIGEGGSGGALAIGVGDQVLMLENSIYSVITPEGCAAILWKDAAQAERAAEGLKLTAEELYKQGIIDRVVPEPPAGAHTDYDEAARLLDISLSEALALTVSQPISQRLRRRYEKLREYGKWGMGPPPKSVDARL
ncbi:MAG TPA: acetyl-CoA carboxylase carboxyltransferase subunit alpha [Pyrinomonadaceae bacterium]|jgi:acetyl-CoA carboxylase carboxyl transferase subunit alpha|nr:acetyl-CoA carboxylase carboxyltransferase subunit alpha [Pyrinomonadaceae bacterium]